MEWLEAVNWPAIGATSGWVLTSLTAVTGMVLGIRAERRHKYRAMWVLNSDRTLTNRTGEDVANVRVFELFEDGSKQETVFGTVAPDERISPPVPEQNRRFVIVWTRPSADRKLHVWPHAAKRNVRRLRREWRDRRYAAQKADRRVGEL